MRIESQILFNGLADSLKKVCSSPETFCQDIEKFNNIEKIFDDCVINHPESSPGTLHMYVTDINRYSIYRDFSKKVENQDNYVRTEVGCEFTIKDTGTGYKIMPECFERVDTCNYDPCQSDEVIREFIETERGVNSSFIPECREGEKIGLNIDTWADTMGKAGRAFGIGFGLVGTAYFTTRAYKEIRKLSEEMQSKPEVKQQPQSAKVGVQEKASGWKALAYAGGAISSAALATYSYQMDIQ